MKLSISAILILTFTYYANSQNIDSLFQQLKSAEKTSKIHTLNELGLIYARLNFDSARYFLEEAYKLSIEGGNPLQQVTSRNYLGMANAIHGQLNESVINFNHAVEICEEYNLDSALAQSYYGLGNVYQLIGDLNGSIQAFVNALSYFEKMGMKENIIKTKANMSYVYRSLNQNGKAIELIRESNSYYKKHELVDYLMNGYSRIASVFRREKELDSSIYYTTKAIDIATELKDKLALSQLQANLGSALLDQDKYEKSIAAFKASLDHRVRTGGGISDMLITYNGLMLAYIRQNDWVEGLKYAQKAEAIVDEVESLESKKDYFHSRYMLDSLSSNFLESIANYQTYIRLRDSLQNNERIKAIAEIETKYETEKKDSEIASLSQQAQIQALQISQRNNQLIGAVVVLLVLVLGAVVMNQQRKLKHQQAVSDMEQRMLRLQMNPHFIFNALASIQNFILKSNTKESVSYLAKFGKLMRQILEHSREEFISISEEVDMLKNYIEIQQLRFNDSFDFSIEIDSSFNPEETKIPPLFAQPFVENAIEHGLKDKKADGLLSIRFKPDGSNVLLEVEDNGSGLNASANTGQNHKSLATRITRERLVIFEKKFGLALPLKVQSQGEGTLATMLLPVIS